VKEKKESLPEKVPQHIEGNDRKGVSKCIQLWERLWRQDQEGISLGVIIIIIDRMRHPVDDWPQLDPK